jgi:hypothetical protein
MALQTQKGVIMNYLKTVLILFLLTCIFLLPHVVDARVNGVEEPESPAYMLDLLWWMRNGIGEGFGPLNCIIDMFLPPWWPLNGGIDWDTYLGPGRVYG